MKEDSHILRPPPVDQAFLPDEEMKPSVASYENQSFSQENQASAEDIQKSGYKSDAPGRKIHSLERMKEITNDLKAAGKITVFTNGCFDIIHVGHIRYLRQAKSLGDILVVGLNTDSSVRMNKGESRPIVTGDERAEVLAALEMVDYIVMFSELTPESVILALRPDIQVKGGDYTVDQLPEAKAVESYGGKVVIVPEIKGKATTNIIDRILKAYCPDDS